MTREGETYTATSEAPRQHGRDLIPNIRAILGRAGLLLAEIEIVGVGTGPGSYTGLRVGVMAAKTIAYATGADLVGLDTLEAVARNGPGDANRIAVIADAQRGDLYVAEWARDYPGGPLRLTQPCRVEPLLSWLARLEPATMVLGPALESGAIRSSIPPHCLSAEPGSGLPEGRQLIELALGAHSRGVRDDLWNLEPHYLRKSSAEDKWEAQRPPVG